MLTAKAAHRKDLSGKPTTMTHQHFRKIAEIIRLYGSEQGEQDRAQVAAYFADELAATNPSFNRARFIAACAVQGDCL